MRKILFSITFLLLVLFSSSISFSQYTTFDMYIAICSSGEFDYANPKTENTPYIYSGPWTKSLLVYEKKTSSYSNIAVREMTYYGYGPEIMITNDINCFNINPSIDRGILVWQSDKHGNWDIYYSQYNLGTWIQPKRLDSTLSNETEPHIFFSKYHYQDYFYYLVFKRDNDIGFKKYQLSTEYWAGDTIVTGDIDESCLSPLIINHPGYRLCFLKQINDTTRRIVYKPFKEQGNPHCVTWFNSKEIYQPKTQENIGACRGDYTFLTYDYDTLNTLHTLGIMPENFSKPNIFTKIPLGKNINGIGIECPVLVIPTTDTLQYNAFGFEAFAFIRKSNDSTMICAAKDYYEGNNPTLKRFYVGDASTEVKFELTPRLYRSDRWYKIRIIWEQKINNKTALVESYMTDFYTYTGNIPEIYALFQNYPNPFNPSTNIRFYTQKYGHVKLVVYDMLGRKITTLVDDYRKAGDYEIVWNAKGYPNGVYYCRLITDEFTDVKKMVFLK